MSSLGGSSITTCDPYALWISDPNLNRTLKKDAVLLLDNPKKLYNQVRNSLIQFPKGILLSVKELAMAFNLMLLLTMKSSNTQKGRLTT